MCLENLWYRLRSRCSNPERLCKEFTKIDVRTVIVTTKPSLVDAGEDDPRACNDVWPLSGYCSKGSKSAHVLEKDANKELGVTYEPNIVS